MHPRLWTVLSFLVLAFFPAAARAQTLAERIPEDALFYMGWAGTDALQADYDASSLKGVLDASTLPQFLSERLPSILVEHLAGDEPGSAVRVRSAANIGRLLGKYPTAIYAGPLSWIDRRGPQPRFALLCQAGNDAPQLLSDCLNLVTKAQGGTLALQAMQAGNLVIVTLGPVDAKSLALMKGEGGATLAAKPQFLAALQQAQTHPAFCAYMDIQALLAEIDTGVLARADVRTRSFMSSIFDTLGLRSVRQAAFTAAFENKGWTEYAFVGLSGPRVGILSLLDAKPLSDRMLEVVPENAVAFNAIPLDLNKIFTQLRDGIGKVDRRSQREFDEAMARFNANLRFNLQKDLLAPLGDTWVLYQTPATDDAPAGMTLVHPARDPEKLKRTLRFLESLMQEADLVVNQERFRGIDYAYVQTPSFIIAWGIVDGHLIVSQKDTFLTAAFQIRNKQTSIVLNDDFRAVRQRLGPMADKALTIEYANLPKLYPEIANGALGLLAMANMFGINVPPSIIPDPEKAVPFMTSGGGITWVDNAGLHSKVVSAFPGAALIVGQDKAAMLAFSAMASAILVPALDRARELADRTADALHLNAVGKAAFLYSTQHDNRFPEHLAELVAAGMLDPKDLVRPGSGTEPATFTPEQVAAGRQDWHAIEQIVDAHCDYLYLGAGTTVDADTRGVLALTKPAMDSSGEGVNCLFFDGHVNWVPMADLRDLIEATQQAHANAQWPAIDVDQVIPEDADDAGDQPDDAAVPDDAVPADGGDVPAAN